MQRLIFPALALTMVAAGVQAQGLPLTAKALNAANTQSIEIAGSGSWYQFGQAPRPGQPWPRFALNRYSAAIDYETASARVQIARIQTPEPGRQRPVPVEQNVDQYVAGRVTWSRSAPNSATAAAPGSVQPQPAALEEHAAEIWATPQGFLRAAQANAAKAEPAGGQTRVSFTLDGKYRYEGLLNARREVERVRTWIANPVLGDTLVETRFSGYKDFGGVPFPSRIVRTLGGHPVLDLQVTSVKLNPKLDIAVPPEASAAPPAIAVTASPLAEGVFHLTGGTHHSVAIEQQDHVIVVEAPLHEQRSLAVIAKVKEIRGKPIRYLVNTHAHFDHSGGLRSYVDEGAIIVTPKANQAYYQQAWAAPRSLAPDRLAASKKPARFETFADKHVLSDGKRRVELHSIAGNGHNDAFALVYLPAEKILVEADAYTPAAADAPPPASVNPYSVNLYENIQKLNLDVERIAALHGPRVVSLGDLRRAIRVD